MIDIHSHILPGVDDGAWDFDDSVAMVRSAAADGCAAMLATPHLRHERWWNSDQADLDRRFAELRRRVSETGETIELYFGGEVAVGSESFEEMLEGPGSGLPSLAGSRYLLVELDWRGLAGPPPDELVHELLVAGWWPIIAHPERVPWLMNDPALVTALATQGALFQITAGSLTGDLGRSAQRASVDLLDQDRVQFVASDAHDLNRRPPGLARARTLVAETWGEERARDLFEIHPRAVLDDRPLGPAADDRRFPTGLRVEA